MAGCASPATRGGIKKTLVRNDGLTLSKHVNSDQLIVLGVERRLPDFSGANVPNTFWVRHMAVTKVISFPISVILNYIENIKEEEKKGGIGLDSPRRWGRRDWPSPRSAYSSR